MKALSISPYPLRIIKPLIGVLSHPIGTRARPILANFRELVTVGKKRGLTVYVFQPQNVDWKKRQVIGWILHSTDSSRNRWVLYRFPLFDVVYNRLPNRKIESRLIVKQFIERLQQENIPFFNPCFLDKWIIYSWLAKDRRITSNLPRTELLNQSGLQQMLDSYGSVYIKPRLGSLGRGIVRIDRSKHGFRITSKATQGYLSYTETNLEKVVAQLKFPRSLNNYIMQETINLSRYKERIFDIRALVQKDIQGEWKVTGIGVRLGADDAHLTHVPNGGEVLPLNTVLGDLLGNNEIRMHVIYERIIEMTKMVASSIEKSSGLTFGELSLDIALDNNLSLWLIEANSKPFRFDEPEIRKLSRNRVLDYATYLTRQK